MRTSSTLRDQLRALDAEQADFEHAVPFEAFAAGVKQATRFAAPPPLPSRPRRWIWGGAGTLALVAAAFAVVPRWTDSLRSPVSRLKGADDPVVVRVSDGHRQRDALPHERLAPGERVRIGIKAPSAVQVVVMSIDEQGVTTPLYPQTGANPLAASLVIGGQPDFVFLPDSVEFTGHGQERLVILLADTRLSVAAVAASLRDAFVKAQGQVASLEPPAREGLATFSFLFDKP